MLHPRGRATRYGHVTTFDQHPHREVLRSVERPARYAGPEYGVARPRPGAEVSLALAFPDVYEVGCSNLGLTILYRRVAAIEWVHVERAFAPWPDYAQALLAAGQGLCSRESATPLGEFDVLGFSLQHELTFTTVLWMLDLSSIPIRTLDRDGSHPLVIAGGPSATNPEPLADFVDAFVPGDGEQVLPSLLSAVRDGRRQETGRGDLLARLASLGHVYVPSLYERVPGPGGRRVVVGSRAGAPVPVPMAEPAPLGGEPVPVPVVPAVETVFDRVQVEIARGCSGGCRFCHAGIVYRPVRERSPGEIVEAAVEQVMATGYDEVSLSSLSTADYPALVQVVRALGPILEARRIALSVASLRAYGLPDPVLEAIQAVRATGMTLAPEAGSDRLRAIVNKTVTRDDLRSALARIRERGWQKVKLYFMVGLPGERDEDIVALADLLADVARIWRPGRGRGRLSASVSNFVPKPFTAFEREAMLDPGSLSGLSRRIRRLTRSTGVSLSFHDPWQSWVEGLLARGGQELCNLLEAAYRAGCRLDGWSEHFDLSTWRDALGRSGIDADSYACRLDGSSPLPWDVLSVHVDRGFLAGEAGRARLAVPTQRCDSPSMTECNDCGAPCDPDQAALAHGDDTSRGLARAREVIERAEAGVRSLWGTEAGGNHFVALTFDRLRGAAYLGHRDTIRVVAQSLRRACVPLRYSKGFTPRPRLVFRAALPVGVVGLGEEVCAEVMRSLEDGDRLLARLAHVCPDGIEFTSARAVSRESRRLIGRGPAAMQWFLLLESGDAERALESILGADELVRERRVGRRIASVDLRPLITAACVTHVGDLEPPFSRLEAGSGLDAAACVIVVEARPAGGKWIRGSELGALLAEHGVVTSWIARTPVAPGQVT